MEQVIATRTELISKALHLKLAKQGKDLLKQKQEALMIEFIGSVNDGVRSEYLLSNMISQAQYALAIAYAVDGPVAVHSISFASKGKVRVDIKGSQIMGIKLPEVNRVINADRSMLDRGYGITTVSSRIDEVSEKFERLINSIIDTAHVETRLRRLGEEILKTRRRVNALELMVVPRLTAEIKHIRMALEERDRENLFRLKKLKKVLTFRRDEDDDEGYTRIKSKIIIPQKFKEKLSEMNLLTLLYRTIDMVTGPLIYVENIANVSYGEMVELIPPSGAPRTGQVLEIDEDRIMIQVFEGTDGIDTKISAINLKNEPPSLDVSMDLLGRTLDGIGKPIDGFPPIIPEERVKISGYPINPCSRAESSDYIETGIAAIDVMNTLLQGQKLAIFSCSGLPANRIAAHIANHAKVGNEKNFVVIFAAMGITHQEKSYFMNQFYQSGISDRLISFINLASDPTVERVITPRCALTTAEFLAFKHDLHVLVVMTNMTNYCEALREISAAREEVPGRRGYPSYMYTDLASIYERAGKIKGKKGSITQISILTMPDDDITHPIPDLTAYTTDVQLVLSRELYSKGVYPPIDILHTPPRVMNIRAVTKKTRNDYQELVDQLYGAYAHGRELQKLVSILGQDSLSYLDRSYLDLVKAFEERFIHQEKEFINIFDSMENAWRILDILPPEIVHHHKKHIPLTSKEEEERLLERVLIT